MTHGNEVTVSLRDWFAGQALVGLTSQMKPGDLYSLIAVECFVAADAMLAERAKNEAAPVDETPGPDVQGVAGRPLSAIERELVEALADDCDPGVGWLDVEMWSRDTNKRIVRALAAWYADAKERL